MAARVFFEREKRKPFAAFKIFFLRLFAATPPFTLLIDSRFKIQDSSATAGEKAGARLG